MTTKDTRLLRLPEVKQRTGFSSADTIYRLVREGKFPAPVKLTSRSSAWKSDAVQAWIDSRPTAKLGQSAA